MILFISIILMSLFYWAVFEILSSLFSPFVAIFFVGCVVVWIWIKFSDYE